MKIVKGIPDTEWLRKRKQTFLMLLYLKFSLALEFSMFHVTLWNYVAVGMDLPHKDLWYGLIAAVKFILPITLNYPVSRWFDAHRKLRVCSISITILAAIGYILYAISSSPFFPLCGTILQGSNYILLSLMTSEIFRVYEADETQDQIVKWQLAHGIGEIVGPIGVILLENIHFDVGELHFMYGNVFVLPLFIMTLVRLFLSYHFVHDLSIELDLKRKNHQQALHNAMDKCSNNSDYSEESNAKLTDLRRYMSTDIYILLIQQLVSACLCSSILTRLIPLIVDDLQYSNLVVQLSFCSASLFDIIISTVLKFIQPGSIGIYRCGVLSVIIMVVAHLILFVLKVASYSDAMNYFLIACYIISYAVSWVCESIFIVTTIGKLAHTSRQSSIEGIRMIVHMLASFCGALTSTFVYRYYVYLFPVFTFIFVVSFVVMIVRKNTLSNPVCVEVEQPLLHLLSK